jgi:DNA repair protein RecO (recombination protein O)
VAERLRENAICLYATDFSETSQVVHMLGRETGVVHLLAKGAKRAKSKTGGRIDLLAEGELVFTAPRGDALGTLIEFAEQTSHSGLRTRLAPLNAALYMLEVTHLLLAEQDPHPKVFDLLSAAMRRLENPDAPTQAVLAYFQWRLLRNVGLLGDMEACVGCGEPVAGGPAFFTSREGGLLCRNCQGAWTEKHALTRTAQAGLTSLRNVERGRREPLGEPAAAAVNELLAYHITYQLGKPPAMLRHIRPRRPGGK